MLRRMKSLAITACLALLAGLSGAYAQVPHQALDFETGNFKWWETKRLVAPYSAQIVTSPARVGRYAARFELRAGDFVSDGYRAELKDRWYTPINSDIWYGFSTMIPEDFPLEEDNSCVLTQWHDFAEGPLGEITRSPPMAIRYADGELYVSFRTSPIRIQKEQAPEQIIYREPNYRRGVWQDFVFHVKWSFKSDGFVEAWKNGRKIINYKGPVGYNDAVGPYVKLGVYCRKTPAKPLVVYHDQYARGNSYYQVDPSRQIISSCGSGASARPVLNLNWEFVGYECRDESHGR